MTYFPHSYSYGYVGPGFRPHEPAAAGVPALGLRGPGRAAISDTAAL